MQTYIAEMVRDGSIMWERLAELEIVVADSLDGLSDAKFLVGDDTLADADRQILAARPGRLVITADGIEIEDEK